MIQHVQSFDKRRDSSLKHAEPRGRADACFKPVALPAVAAAVCVTARPEPRKPAARDLPAVLRDDAPID